LAAQPLSLVLASASPRRAELLRRSGIEAHVRPAAVDELMIPGERPREYVERMAREKLGAALEAAAPEDALVLAADTIVAEGDAVFLKPDDDEHALSMLARLAGRTHEVLTAVALGRAGEGVLEEITVTTEVRFRPASREELLRYVATGEGRDKAGSYAIQGIGAGLVQGIHGSYTNVVGLPLVETLALLGRHGGLVEWP
jgi:septum formation protein